MTKLWLLSQSTVTGYDTYDFCVVVASTEEEARNIYPSNYFPLETLEEHRNRTSMGFDWPSLSENVKATYLGIAEDPTKRVVCASFNAG